MKNFLTKILTVICIVAGIICFPGFVFASTTDGTIDGTYKYAWSENAGWINFGTTSGNVHVTDSGLTGYAWSDNFGWINLNPSVSGVDNNGQGTLSGYAWGQNLGWINFSGVTINNNGEFSGTASNDITGVVSFNCANCKVQTDWRPQSARPVCNNATDDDGDGKTDYPNDPGCSSLEDNDETDPGGGGLPSQAYNPPAPPSGGFKVLINNNDEYTKKREVALNLFAGKDTERMAISNNPDLKEGTGQIPYQSSYIWDLCFRGPDCSEGTYTVYVKFFTGWGQSSEIVSDSIIYKKEIGLIEVVPEFLKPLIPEFLKPRPPEVKPEIKPEEVQPVELPIEELVPKEAPLSLQGKWQLLSSKPLEKFVLAPLPKGIQVLVQKFPQLKKTFKEVGIAKITDVEKLKTAKITLPGLTETVGLLGTEILEGKFVLPKGIPVANLSLGAKMKVPTEIVFARTGGEVIDFRIALSISEQGKTQQKIVTIAGKPLQLVVKPEKPVESIRGYIIFKSKKPKESSLHLPFDSLAASLLFAGPNLALAPMPAEQIAIEGAQIPVFEQTTEKKEEKTGQALAVEQELVLQEFEYTDPDGDGIYTAEINMPVVDAEYEIITVMDYKDPELGAKEIRMITVVDPEGYIYEKDGDKETRINGAIVSLYWLNPNTTQYELWPAKEYQQENPQTTNVRGTYSFLVPEGHYYLKITTPGYTDYDGKPFEVKEGSGIHFNIEMKTKYWFLKLVDLKTVLLLIVILLLLYNFYRDKIREKLTPRPPVR